MRTLYVGGLEQTANTDFLTTVFGAFGQVRDARVVMRPATGRCRGFGYVTFLDDRAAEEALVALDGSEIEGSTLRVEMAG